ncbi:hypothetical protein DCC79_09670 [bacterium]|nr:MAG: hypothetical protein DCC79_09670 [bacterium]
MAHLIQAIQRYGPRLVLGPAVDAAALARWLADRAGVDAAATRTAVADLHAAVEHFTALGRPVMVPGIGCFRPTIGRDGRRRLVLIPAPELAGAPDRPGRYAGAIRRLDRAGWTDADYKRAWDHDHPDDPLDLPADDGGVDGIEAGCDMDPGLARGGPT